MKRTFVLPLLLGVLLFVSPVCSYGAWTNNPGLNTPIFEGSNDQYFRSVVSDGSGGAIIIWENYNFGHQDVYAQKIDRRGFLKWPAEGVRLTDAVSGQIFARATIDGAGGAIIAWSDARNANMDIYAQRISSSGAAQWPQNGVPVSVPAGAQEYPQIIADGSGGAIIVWQDKRSGNYDIYAQKVNAAGTRLWTNDGVAICTSAGDQTKPVVVPDGSGGAIVAWHDKRAGSDSIYAQLIDANGAVQWGIDGVALTQAEGAKSIPQITADGNGGAIVVWQDTRSGQGRIYAQKINAFGLLQLAADGQILADTGSGYQYDPQIVSDGSGGAIVVWQDYRNGDGDIYAQKMNSANVFVWTSTGKAVNTSTGNQQYPMLAADGSGGAVIVWQHYPQYYLYAQRLGTGGNQMWPPDGINVSIASDTHGSVHQLIGDGSGGAIISWTDYRNGNGDIYAQRVLPNGELPLVYDSSVSVALTCPVSVTAGSTFNVTVNLTNEDCTAPVSVTRFSKMMLGNADGTLSGLGISGPVNTGLTKSVPSANCSSWPVVPGTLPSFNLQMTAPGAWGGKAAQVTIDAVDAQGQSLGSGECMVPVQ